MIKLEAYFAHFVTLVLLVSAVIFRSSSLGYAAVLSLLLVLAKGILEVRWSALTIKTEVPEEMKKQIQDMNARIATLEFGVKTRGF